MLFSPDALKSLNNIVKKTRMMCASFNSNPCSTIASCYSFTNAGEETDMSTFYNKLSSLIRHIPNHNILIIGGDIDAQKTKMETKNLTNSTRQIEMGYIEQILHSKIDVRA